MSAAPNPFETYWALGYKTLVPIVPPDAIVSAKSSLSKRLNTKSDPRGKAPGVRSHSGDWHSFDWLQHQTDITDVARWHRMGAGVGIRTGDGLLAIDADTLDDTHARTIRDIVKAHLGETPIRVGNYPKALYLIRCSEPYRYTRVEFGTPDDKGRLTDRVEILSDGKQFVATGIHPKTLKPYHWPKPILPIDELPTFDAATIDAMMAAIQQALPQAKPMAKEGSASDVNQQALRGDPETVRRAVEATPNTSEHFPTRESFVAFGYAIKAALPDNQNEALALYEDWAARWEDDTNPPDFAAGEWSRMQPPFKVGSGWLYQTAERTSGGKFREVDAWFQPVEQDDNPFAQIREQEAATGVKTYPLLSVDDLLDRPPPEWLIERYFPKVGTGFLYSAPGAGKTFWILDAMLTVASGQPDWHGNAIVPNTGLVLYLAAEGSYGFRNRVKAWLTARGKATADLRSFRLIEKTINFMNADDIERLVRTIDGALGGGMRLSAIVVDTVSRAIPGADENLQKDMTRFVQACDIVRDRYGCTVVGVHHAGKNGDIRGSTVITGAGDFVFGLVREKGKSIGRITCVKMKDGPDGWDTAFRFDALQLDDGQSSIVVSACEDCWGPSATLTPDTAAMVLDAMRAAWDSGEPWAKGAKAGERWAVRRMVADFGFSGDKAEETLEFWESVGDIENVQHSSKSKRMGYKVGVKSGHAVQQEGIFG